MTKPKKMKRLGAIFLFTWLGMYLFHLYHDEGFNQDGASTVFLVLGLTFFISGTYQERKKN